MNARLKLLHEKANVKQVKLLPTTVVGRSTECDLKIASSQVSRVHCRITVAEDAVYIEDLGSANGTFVNDQMLVPRKPTAVQPGAKISIGPAEFLVDYIAPTSNTVVIRRSGSGGKPTPEDFRSEADGGEKDLIFTSTTEAAEETVNEAEATLFGARMENLVAAAMDAIQPESFQRQAEPQPVSKAAVANPQEAPEPVQIPATVPLLAAIVPAPAPPPIPVVMVAQLPAAPPIVAPAAPSSFAATVAAPVAPPIAKTVAVAAVPAGVVLTARAVPVQAVPVIPKAEPVAPPVENPFQFGQAPPAKAKPVSEPAKTPASLPAKVAPAVAAVTIPAPAVIAPPQPVIVAPQPLAQIAPQPFAQFAEPAASNPVAEDGLAFDFAAETESPRASKPAAKGGKAAAGGLKSLLSVFGRKPNAADKKSKAASPAPEAVEEVAETPAEGPVAAASGSEPESAGFAFGGGETAAEESLDGGSSPDDFQDFLKQF